MLAAVLSGFALSSVAPWLQRVGRETTGWIIALLPLSLFVYFASLIGPVAANRVFIVSYPWIPSLDITLSFYLDGLSLLFALLITGIGAFVIVYASGYLAHHHHLGRFYTFMLLFMASMLGLVLADNVITLFVFWELTTFTSYLLIGFEHEESSARSAAWQALLLTGAGGLALLAGLIMLSLITGSWELSALIGQGDVVRSSALYVPILILVLAGAFTKSAQVPFHFWLPNAMAAPTPASAYLHSATMVKAGIYLLARLSPTLGDTAIWQYTITGFGAATMFVGAYLAWSQTDLKRVLAYSTVSALGTLTMLIGIGTYLAIEAMIVFLLGHALYKGALFLVVGAIDHETGTRDIDQLRGLCYTMPITAAAAWFAALSMGSLPLFLGFIGKELLYEAVLHGHIAEIILIILAVFSNMLYIAAAGIAGLLPFVGQPRETPKHPHEAPFRMLLGPLALAGLGTMFGLAPMFADSIVAQSVNAVTVKLTEVELAIWHGLTLTLLLSMITIAGGITMYLNRERMLPLATIGSVIGRWGPGRWYDWVMSGFIWFAKNLTDLIQHGYLRLYLLTIMIATLLLTSIPLLREAGPLLRLSVADVRFHEAVLAVIILLAALVAVRAQSRLGAIAALGIVGFGIAIIFVLFSAPDLAMTQFAVETLTVIIFVLVLYRLPRYESLTSVAVRVRDTIIALLAGATVTTLILIATNIQFEQTIATYFIEHSTPDAHGHNIVNVILVDFRGMDTLGEITVLALAGIGVYGLLRLRLREQQKEIDQ